jgi:hypothetical protein
MVTPSPRALVLIRVPRGAASPPGETIERAIRDDRRRLGLPEDGTPAFLVAGPYAIEMDGQALDEYVAWEV